MLISFWVSIYHCQTDSCELRRDAFYICVLFEKTSAINHSLANILVVSNRLGGEHIRTHRLHAGPVDGGMTAPLFTHCCPEANAKIAVNRTISYGPLKRGWCFGCTVHGNLYWLNISRKENFRVLVLESA